MTKKELPPLMQRLCAMPARRRQLIEKNSIARLDGKWKRSEWSDKADAELERDIKSWSAEKRALLKIRIIHLFREVDLHEEDSLEASVNDRARLAFMSSVGRGFGTSSRINGKRSRGK
jgi:hypothetical protein